MKLILSILLFSIESFADIKPLNKSQIQQFLSQTNIFDAAKDEINGPNESYLHSKTYKQNFSIYEIDLNNDGSNDAVLVSEKDGPDDIRRIFKVFNKNKELPFGEVASRGKLCEGKPKCQIADPPFILKDGKILIQYNIYPGSIFNYLWENNTIKLIK